MPVTPHVVVVGSHAPGVFIRVKRVPTPGETVIGWDFQEPMDGGKGSNQAIAAARLGAKVSFVGCVGRDRIGDEGARWLREAGVDVTYVRRSDSTASGVGVILLDADGLPAMVTSMGANADLSEQDVEAALEGMSSARVMLTQFEIRPEVALCAVRIARRHGMMVIVNAAPAPAAPITGLGATDILTPNEVEAKTLLGMAPTGDAVPEAMAEQLRHQSGAGCVVITLGEKGIVGADRSGVWHVRPPSVQVVDTSGAGDMFCAALAVALDRRQAIRAASKWACAAAALSVTRPGTIPAFPTLEQVERFLHTSGYQ